MTSQLLSSKLPLQGQKELEHKDLTDRDGDKDLYKTLCKWTKNAYRIQYNKKHVVLSDHVQPMCTAVKITDQEILNQEDKGKTPCYYI